MTEPPAKRQKFDLSETIIIVAGKEDKSREFTAHTSYAIAASIFIKAALSRDWKEAKERRIAIPDTEPESTEGYLNWVYSNTITFGSKDDKCALCKRRSNSKYLCIVSTSWELVNMYVLGDYLGDLRF